MIIVLALVAFAAVVLAIVAATGKVPLWISVLLVSFVVLVQLALQVWK